MKLPLTFLLATPLLFPLACSGSHLPPPDREITEILVRLAAGQEAEETALADDLAALNRTLLETFAGNYLPVPEDALVPFDPARPRDYAPIDGYRWGYALPADPENEKSVGAFVARPVSVPAAAMSSLDVGGDIAGALATNYRSYVQRFDEPADGFLSGARDRVTSSNRVVTHGSRGIVFQYDSRTLFRRIRDARLPGEEAVVSWERMEGEARRLEGGYDAYFRYLKNLNVLLTLSGDLSWWLVASWNVSGGSFFIFSGSGTSGDIGDGIRNDFADREAYFTAQGESCLPERCELP